MEALERDLEAPLFQEVDYLNALIGTHSGDTLSRIVLDTRLSL